MKALIVGATGYIGSAVVRSFQSRGMDCHGLARSPAAGAALIAAGVEPCDGDLSDRARLKAIVAPFDVVVLVAPVPREDEPHIASAVIEGCLGRGAHFIFTSGTGILSHESPGGRWDDRAYTEDDFIPYPVARNRAIRVATEDLVRRAACSGLHTTVIRPPLVYGRGGSSQVPAIFSSVEKSGAACYVGYGLNLYSNVHVDDLAEAYALAVEKGVPGALYHTVAGEANFREIAEAVAQAMGVGTRSLDYDEACAMWGEFVVANALAVNSRSVSRRARSDLGWEPHMPDLISDIRRGSYREAYEPSRSRAPTISAEPRTAIQ